MNCKFVLIGLPSWCLVNGTFAVLHKLVDTQPEKYDLAGYLVMCLSIGNFMTLLFSQILKSFGKRELLLATLCLLIVGFSVSLGLAFLYDITVANFSLPLFLLFFICGVCSSASNIILFMLPSYCQGYPTSSVAFGMGCGTMIAGVLALIEGSSSKLLFTITLYYCLMAVLYVVALFALYELYNSDEVNVDTTSDHHILLENDDSNEKITSRSSKYMCLFKICADVLFPAVQVDEVLLLNYIFMFLYGVFGYGLIPSIIAPLCSRFRSSNKLILYATSFGCIIDPISRYIAHLFVIIDIKVYSAAITVFLVLSLSLIVTYYIPSGGVFHSEYGGLFPVFIYCVFVALFSFMLTSEFSYFQSCNDHGYVSIAKPDLESTVNKNMNGRALELTPPEKLRVAGISLQCGALCGSVLALILLIST